MPVPRSRLGAIAEVGLALAGAGAIPDADALHPGNTGLCNIGRDSEFVQPENPRRQMVQLLVGNIHSETEHQPAGL